MNQEEEWVRRAQAGDREAFGEIVRSLESEVVHFAFRLHGDRDRAEDLAQEAFVEAFRRLAFLRDATQLRGWLRGIVKNLHLARLRREAREPASIEIGEADLPFHAGERDDADAFAGLAPAEIFGILATEIDALPDPYRATLLLRHWEKLSCKAIAKRLDVAVGTVTMRLTRGHRLLREAIFKRVGNARHR
ncbi:MAG: sigma-70 family RNA polymerase sigma factor [Planctomycetes bacterium]|nr:sigma-70 family RNA polymerase sigma factor [Planctomycetota bacterium]MBI3844312.1 sigma-70 family RNA polymerase sigma factor [Planctomycetota bacterium]